jgi:hypothetical protein
MQVPHNLVVKTYTVIQLLLHATEHFLRGLYLGLFLSVSLSARVMRWYVGFLSDIQEVRSQFLQLTASDAHQSSVQAREWKYNEDICSTSNELQQ